MSETIWDSLDRILGMSAMGASATSHEAAKRGRELEAERDRYKAALKYYATQKHLNLDYCGVDNFNFGIPGRIAPPYLRDAEHGYVAKAALKGEGRDES